MTLAEAITRVKYKFGLTNIATLDSEIEEAISIAVDLMTPYLKGVPSVDTTQSLADSEHELTYAQQADKIYYRSTATSDWLLTTDWYQSNGVVYFTSHLGAVDLKIIYYTEYQLATIESIPRSAIPPLTDFACSEFASMLAGDKTHFNAFVQATGTRAVDSLSDLANFYEGRALDRVDRISDAEGML